GDSPAGSSWFWSRGESSNSFVGWLMGTLRGASLFWIKGVGGRRSDGVAAPGEPDGNLESAGRALKADKPTTLSTRARQGKSKPARAEKSAGGVGTATGCKRLNRSLPRRRTEARRWPGAETA